jgi:F-box domain
MPETSAKKRGFGAHFVIPFRSKSSGSRAGSIDSSLSEDSFGDVKRSHKENVSYSRLRKSLPAETNVFVVKQNKPDATKGGLRNHVRQNDFPAVDVSQAWERDKQTGEITDHTDMLHSLVDLDPLDPSSEQGRLLVGQGPTQSGEDLVSRLSSEIWERVLVYMTLADAASLALSCKAFRDLLGLEPLNALKDSDNHLHKIDFLIRMDGHLPRHLFCFTCATYHFRIQHGQESLKPTNIRNPLFNCPNPSIPNKRIPRTRLTFGRTLPFTFVQLALRAHHYSPDHGIKTESLNRRYTDRDSTWSHQTRYAIVKGHLLLRVVSTCFAPAGLPPAGERHLLYSREDFVPYFSVCAHWRDGELMPSVKCALRHIPKPIEGSGLRRVGDEVKYRLHRPNPIITLCSECRPMRRCPECPTEYMIELKMAEDRSDPVNLFKQALVVSRWSDLGDGSSPWSPEWAACNGEAEFDSFKAIGRRAISGVFEAHFNGDLIPGQRIISLNPNKEKRGEAGHNWY